MKLLSKVIKDGQMKTTAAVIGQSRRLPASPIRKEVYHRVLSDQVLASAEAQGAALIAAAQERSRAILEAAEAEAAQIRQKAYEEGYTAGYRDGETAAHRLQEEARELLEDARREKEALLAAAEPEIVALALCLAEKIVNRQLELDRSYILAMLRALKIDTLGKRVIIKVNPELVSFLEARAADLQAIFPHGGYVLKPDAGVKQGVVVETELGTVDATIETQLEELAKVLGEVMARD